MNFAITRDLEKNYEQAIESVTLALKHEGFGVLTQIDMQATLREKLGVAFDRYTILGACNPPLAHKALSAEKAVGLMMPCNVIVYETGSNTSRVQAIDPMATMAATSNEIVGEVAKQVRDKLAAALERA